MHMFKKISLLLSLATVTLLGENIDYAVLDKHAFLPKTGAFDLSLHYNAINDSIDILNIKKSELSAINSNFGDIGDMDGLGAKLRYGLSDSFALFASYEQDNIDYSSQTLKNSRINLFIKYKALESLSLDIGYIRNSSDNLDFKNEAMLNAMIHKLAPSSEISIEDGTIHKGDESINFYEKDGGKIYPYMSIEDTEDNSFYITFLTAQRLNEYLLLDFYLDIKYTKINSKITLQPSANPYISSLLEGYEDKTDLGRSEMTYTPGITLSYGFARYFFLEINYEYAYSARDKELDYITSNHTLKSYLGARVFDSMMIYLGGQVMYRQFSNEISYLYNKYSQTTFDHKYGYAELGFAYSF